MMIKSYWVECELNMDASCIEKVIVKTNTLKKAKKLGVDEFYKRGACHVKLIDCREIEVMRNE